MRGSWGHLLPEIPPGGNYLHFTERASATQTRSSSGALVTGPSCSSSTPTDQPRRSKHSRAPTSGRSTGRIVGLRVPELRTTLHVPRRLRLRRKADVGTGSDRKLGTTAPGAARRRSRHAGELADGGISVRASIESEDAHESSIRWIAAILLVSSDQGLRSVVHRNRNSQMPVAENRHAANTSNWSYEYLRPAPESRVFWASTLKSPLL